MVKFDRIAVLPIRGMGIQFVCLVERMRDEVTIVDWCPYFRLSFL